MNIRLRMCEIDLSRDKIVLSIEIDSILYQHRKSTGLLTNDPVKIYREERSWIAEADNADEFKAVAHISSMLNSIFRDISS